MACGILSAMSIYFRNRIEAGTLLAGKLLDYADRADAVVVALPRGGVPVGWAVARRLRLPFDILSVRKLGAPDHAELAIGAVAPEGVRVLYQPIIETLKVSAEAIASLATRAEAELEGRERAYRGGRPALPVRGRIVILIDDGIATGSSMRAAIYTLRRRAAAEVVVAVPIASPSTTWRISLDADRFCALVIPPRFRDVGQVYADFAPVTEDEVRRLLAEKADGRASETPASRLQASEAEEAEPATSAGRGRRPPGP